MKCLDISRHNSIIDFAAVKAGGIEAVIIRAGYGTTIDPMFERNYAEADKHGFKIGVYWFAYPLSPLDSEREAYKCLAVLNTRRPTLGVWYDYEYDSDAYAQKRKVRTSAEFRTNCLLSFHKVMTTGGNRCGFYLNPDYLTSKVIRDDIKHIPLWLARWVNSTIAKYEDVPIETAPVSEYGMEIWQFGKGYVPGVKGAVDLNYILTKPPDEKPENTDEPSEWAKAATEWAKENGIFAGDGDGNFRWHDKITRQEAAQVIKNMYEFIMNGKGE